MLSPTGLAPTIEYGCEVSFSADGTPIPRAVCYHTTWLNVILWVHYQRKGALARSKCLSSKAS